MPFIRSNAPGRQSSPCLRVSVVISRRLVPIVAVLAGVIIGAAGLLQWFWAGWSVYAGAGPPLAARWLLTGAVGAALLLPPGAAFYGAAVGRRLADPGLRAHVRVTPDGVRRLAWGAGMRAVSPAVLTALLSSAVWSLVSLAGRTGRSSYTGSGPLPGPLAIGCAHGLVIVIAATFAVWGAALAVGASRSRTGFLGSWGEWRASGCWAPLVLLGLCAGPAVIGPVLAHLARPERALDAVLLVNPVTSVGAALGMDVLRSPRVYTLTRAPEYWYTYPPALAVAGVYGIATAAGAYCLRRQLERE